MTAAVQLALLSLSRQMRSDGSIETILPSPTRRNGVASSLLHTSVGDD